MNFRQIKVGLLFMLRVITKKRAELQARMNLPRIDWEAFWRGCSL